MVSGNDLVELLSRGHGNESPEHARLRRAGERLCFQLGLTYMFKGFNRSQWPDILRSTSDGSVVLCIDAKVAKNETSGSLETAERVSGYIAASLACLQYPGVHSVLIGIVTDDAQAAGGWANTLNLIAFLNGRWGNLPNFQVAKLDWETWLVYWVARP